MRLDEIKEKLELLYEEKVKGIVVRARARWHEYGERSTKYFLNLEKRNHVKKHIRKLLISGSITTDPYRTLAEQKRFYQNLYKTKDSVEATDSIEAFLNSLNIPKLSEEQRQSCEGRISTEECRTIIETFQNNKSPGNDGLPIEFYKSCCGVRQGDPLSPYLFLLAVETLAIAIRANEEIKGIVINQEETKLLQHADDTTAVLADLESAQKLFQLLDKFKELSGLKVNSSKTEGMWIGSLKNSENKPLGIKWPTEPIKALGVFFTYDHKLSHSKNFSEKIVDIEKLINIWSSRGLSVYGKVTLIKSLLIPKIVYTSSLLPTPEHIVKDLKHILFKFLWKGKDKVTRASTINNYEEGGVKMVDIESLIKSLRLSWLKRIFSDNSGAWKTTLNTS